MYANTPRYRSMGTFSALLLLLLTLHSASCLKCYVCSSTSSNEYCNSNAEECQPPLDTCMTTVDIKGDMKAIVKQCSSSGVCAGAAGSAVLQESGDGSVVSCCSSRLCNYSSAATIQLCSWLLSLSALLLTLLIKHHG